MGWVLALALCASAVPLEVRGNLVLPDEVYQTIANWTLRARAAAPSEGAPTVDDAEAIAVAVREFLVESGYELARVQADLDGGRVLLEVNEGRMARVLFRGHGTMETLELQLMLDVPHDVFNRKVVQRQLDGLKLANRFEGTRFELVELESFEHRGPQLEYVGRDDLEAPAPLPYELHLVVDAERWATGLAFEAGYESIRGALLDAAYAGESFLYDGDRWKLELGLGATPFAVLGDSAGQGATNLKLSRARAGVTWISPEVLDALRLSLLGHGELAVRQRRDLLLQTYDVFSARPAGELAYRPSGYVAVTVGGGLEYRQVFGVEQVALDPPLPEERGFAQVRAFARLRLELTLDPENVRLDRHHTLALATDAYLGSELWQVEGAYAKVFELGWHDLWLRLQGGGVFGRVRFVDELALANFLRSLFVHEYWVPWVGTMSWEFRYSVRQELFKVGAFLDGGVFADEGRGRRESGTKVAAATGLGVHALVLDLLQLDLRYAFGATTDGALSQGLTLSASKAF